MQVQCNPADWTTKQSANVYCDVDEKFDMISICICQLLSDYCKLCGRMKYVLLYNGLYEIMYVADAIAVYLVTSVSFMGEI